MELGDLLCILTKKYAMYTTLIHPRCGEPPGNSQSDFQAIMMTPDGNQCRTNLGRLAAALPLQAFRCKQVTEAVKAEQVRFHWCWGRFRTEYSRNVSP
jgi:hypothetical protein